ncbi:uncharacterized protein [Hetaerina americana]|uniref:uncharacterized protein n=1 Tax=Hetaerina americana TaxID=62018 RepID=UPI003A7F1DDB
MVCRRCLPSSFGYRRGSVAMDTVSQFLFGFLLLPVMLILASTDTKVDDNATSPSVSILGGPDLFVTLGGPLNLTCIVSQPQGDHEDSSYPGWLHDGTVVSLSSATDIETHASINGSRRSSLLKKIVVRADEGMYTCSLADSAEQSSITLHVVVDDEREDGGSPRLHHPPVVLPPAPAAMMSHVPGGCVDALSGAILANGDEWREDPCTTCRCEDGRKKCHAYMCHTSCINPRHVAGECCPVCDSTSVVTLPPHCPSLTQCSLRCHQGFVKDKDGCFLCQCKAEECKLDCPHGYAEDDLGNKLCECARSSHCPSLSSCKKSCAHGLRTNRHGCPVCKCNKCKRMLFSSPVHMDGSPDASTGSLIESTSHGVLLLCAGPCLHGYMQDDRGCPTCWCNEPPHSSEGITSVYSEEVTKAALSCISSDGVEKSSEDVWWNGCRKCQCVEGVESCSSVNCPSTPPTCDHAIIINGNCCPVCSEPVILITVSVLCALVLAVLIYIAVRIRHYVWWPRRGCLRFADEDGGVRVLGASPSPTDSPGPQGNGIIKYDIPPMPLGGGGVGGGVGVGTGGGGIKGIRRSGEYYESVPRYEPSLGDCEKSALAPH